MPQNLPSSCSTGQAMQQIESVLRKEIGLDAASIGSPAVERMVRLRMKNLALKDTGTYVKLLDSSRAELDELVEAVVVLETWFFRDRGPFTAFGQLALEWLAQHPVGTLRTLSVPCSSGEEPYSLAIALLDAQVPPERFVINAVDISAHALARAREAVYGRNSFRGPNLAFRERYFHQTKDGYALNRAVRDCVQFFRDNLLGETFLVGHGRYDLVFCRNLLIYFDAATQLRALEKLEALLAPNGVLFVGPAELPLATHCGFRDANLTMAFACRKTEKAESRKQNAENTSSPREILPTAPPRATAGLISRGEFHEKAVHSPQSTVQSPQSRVLGLETEDSGLRTQDSDLEVARQLADAGKLEDAAAVCQEHLRRRGPATEAYYLLGLVRDAAGDPQASEYYRKALYLKPDHYETLLQMSLLLEKAGDPAGARIFKRRAQRSQPKCQVSGVRCQVNLIPRT